MNKLTSLTSIGLAAAAALSTNACGGRTELNDQDWQETVSNDGGGNGGEGGTTTILPEGGTGGTGETGGTGGSGGLEGGAGGQGGSVAVPGTITIKNDGELTDIVGQTEQAPIATFRLEIDNVEDQLIQNIKLKVHATQCDGTGISDPIGLYVEGNAEPVAVGQYQDNGGYIGYINFTFPTPYQIGKGDTGFFQVYADQQAACCHFTEETFLENQQDLEATGAIYGQAANVINNYSENDTHSMVDVWGGQVYTDLSFQPATNIPIGTSQASCLDLTVYNCLPQDLALANWQAGLEITNGDSIADAKDLLNTSPAQGNFTLIKLLARDFSGIPVGTLLGPNELYPHGSDVTQQLVLSGNASIPKGERAVLSLSFNVEDNLALIGNQIRCTLGGTPEDTILGNTHTIVAKDFPCLTVAQSTVPTSMNLPKGTQDVEIACWKFQNSCYQTNLLALTAQQYGAGSYNDLNSLRLFLYDFPVSDFENINPSNGELTFNNLVFDNDSTINLGTAEEKRLCAHTNISFSAISGSNVGLQIPTASALTLNPPANVGGQFPVQGPSHVIGQ